MIQNPTLVFDLADPTQPKASRQRVISAKLSEPSEFLASRPDDIVEKAIEKGLWPTIEEPGAGPDPDGKRVVAQAGVIEYGGAGLVHEIGAVHVKRSWQGYGLQKLIMRTMALHVAEQGANLLENRNWTVFAVVANDNAASIASIRGVKMLQASPSLLIQEVAAKYPAKLEQAKKQFYILTPDGLAHVREAMRRFIIDDKCVIRRDAGDVRIVFGERLARYGDERFYN